MEFFCSGDLSLIFHLCIYSILYLIIIDSWVGLFSNTILFWCLNCSSFGHQELFQLALVFVSRFSIIVFVSFLIPHLLVIQDVLSLFYTFTSPVLEPAIYPRSCVSSHWTVVLGTKLLMPGVLILKVFQ